MRGTPPFALISGAIPYRPLAPYGIYVVAALAIVIGWFIGVYLYLRSGHGPKLGLVYDAFDVGEPHVQKVKQTLRRLYKDGAMHRHISLRFLPCRAVSNTNIKDRYIRRFKFSIIAHIGEI